MLGVICSDIYFFGSVTYSIVKISLKQVALAVRLAITSMGMFYSVLPDIQVV